MPKGGTCEKCGASGLEETVDLWAQGFKYDPLVEDDDQFPSSFELVGEDDYIVVCLDCWAFYVREAWYRIVDLVRQVGEEVVK